MSDRRLRELERLADEGDTNARAALLRERVRAGRLDEQRLRLAAYLGEPAARLAAGVAGRLPRDPLELVSGLKPFGPEVPARAALVAMCFLAPHPVEVASAVERWLACPCEVDAREVRAAARRAELGTWEPAQVGPAILVTKLALPRPPPPRRPAGFEGLCWRPIPRRMRGLRYASTASAIEDLHAALVVGLLGWALA